MLKPRPAKHNKRIRESDLLVRYPYLENYDLLKAIVYPLGVNNRIPVRFYTKPFCLDYLDHCLGKLTATMAGETIESLTGESGISFRKGSRMELHIYNTRHIQHHAAQLGLRLQVISGKQMPWFSGHGK